MLDSIDVLHVLNLAYTIYSIVIILLFGWFALRLTRGTTQKLVRPGVFYAYIGVLIFCGVSIHIYTFNKVPWVAHDLQKETAVVDSVIKIEMSNHTIVLPQERVSIKCNELVRFDVVSKDLTYGFGLFRPDQSLVLQMQVVPGSKNLLVWRFGKEGLYDIRSTEYSGPKGASMIAPQSVEVVGCDVND